MHLRGQLQLITLLSTDQPTPQLDPATTAPLVCIEDADRYSPLRHQAIETSALPGIVELSVSGAAITASFYCTSSISSSANPRRPAIAE